LIISFEVLSLLSKMTMRFGKMLAIWKDHKKRPCLYLCLPHGRCYCGVKIPELQEEHQMQYG